MEKVWGAGWVAYGVCNLLWSMAPHSLCWTPWPLGLSGSHVSQPTHETAARGRSEMWVVVSVDDTSYILNIPANPGEAVAVLTLCLWSMIDSSYSE